MSSKSSVDEYLAELPADRLEVIRSVREVILSNLPEGYEETINWGMLCYEVPLSIEPDTYQR